MKTVVIFAVALIVSATALSACGKRGELIPPAGSTYPQQYPKQ